MTDPLPTQQPDLTELTLDELRALDNPHLQRIVEDADTEVEVVAGFQSAI